MDRQRLEDIAQIRVGCLFISVAIMCLPFLVIGSAMTVVSMKAAVGQAASNRATARVEAEIISSRVVEFATPPVGGGAGRTAHTTPPDEFTPRIEFAYDRNGVRETSEARTPVGRPGTRAWADRVAAGYPAGKRVQAWLPDDPSRRAFLEKDWNTQVYAGIGAGVGAIGFCGSLLAVSGGWRWTERAWLGALAASALCVLVLAWGIWHCLTFVPPGETPAWMIGVAVAAFGAGLLPVAGAWQASRVARSLRDAGFE
jgi:hypothetical protein